MIARADIIQQTPEWFRIKYGRIGGTASKQLLIESDALENELIAARLEPFEEPTEPGFENPDMKRGNELEQFARHELSKYLNVSFNVFGWLQCEEFDILGISPDGLNESETIACEIKCPAAKKHTETLRGGIIPKDHVAQCVHNFTVNPKLQIIYFCSFRPESKHRLFVKAMNLETIVDFGTKAKPNAKPVKEWVKIAKDKAKQLTEKIESELLRLEF